MCQYIICIIKLITLTTYIFKVCAFEFISEKLCHLECFIE